MDVIERVRELIDSGHKPVEIIGVIRKEFDLGLVDANKIVKSVISGKALVLDETPAFANPFASKHPVTISNELTYKGGHPKLTKEKDCALVINDDGLKIKCGTFSSAFISMTNITGVHFETQDQIERRYTATRILTLGVFALAFKKKKKTTDRYFIVDYVENGIENTVVFIGDNASKAHAETYEHYMRSIEKFEKVKAREEVVENISKSTNSEFSKSKGVCSDPYEELKKLKELLDIGIITQEDFDTKKKQLLNI